MGNELSFVIETAAYPVKASVNIINQKIIDDESNLTNSNIIEFNPNFNKKEEKITNLDKKLIDDVDSSAKTFNANIVFQYSKILEENLKVYGRADRSGECLMKVDKLIFILEKLMELYITDHTKITEPENPQDLDKTFCDLHKNIESNLVNVSRTYVPIQKIFTDNDQLDIEDFKEKINEEFNTAFLSEYSIKQYLTLLVRLCDTFMEEIDIHISFFKEENKNKIQKFYDWTIGSFTWLGRSGYSYQNTATFYKYFKDNNIEKLLKDKVNDHLESIENANKTLKSIRKQFDTLNDHILENLTDKLEFTFKYKNKDKKISIKLGNYRIDNYEVLCELINEKMNAKLLDEKMEDVTFNITHQHESFKNHILIQSNTTFTLTKNSSLMKVLGWEYSNKKCQNKLNANNEIVGKFLLSPTQLLNKEINDSFDVVYCTRHNQMITDLTQFVNKMNLPRTSLK